MAATTGRAVAAAVGAAARRPLTTLSSSPSSSSSSSLWASLSSSTPSASLPWAVDARRTMLEYRGVPVPPPPYNEWVSNRAPLVDPKDPRYDPDYVEPLRLTDRLHLETSTTQQVDYAYGFTFRECLFVFGAPFAVLWFGLGWSSSPGFNY